MYFTIAFFFSLFIIQEKRQWDVVIQRAPTSESGSGWRR